MSNTVVLDAVDLSQEYPGIRALTEVSLRIDAGEVVGLVGHNGAGKSTLTRILGGVERCTSGALHVGGQPVDFHGPQDALRAGIAVVPQHLNVVPGLTVEENLLLGRRRPAGTGRRQAKDETARGLTLVGDALGIADRMKTKVRDCSPSTQRLVMIGRALLNEPILMILDEPTAALHPVEADKMFAAVNDLRKSGMGVIFISHRLDEVLRVSSRIVALRQGNVIADTTADGMTRADLAALIAGGQSSQPGATKDAVVPGETAVVCRDIVAPTVSGASLQACAGEIVGLAGLQSSGSSGLLKAIAGLTPISGGEIRVGRTVLSGRRRDAMRAGVAYLPDDRLKNGIVPDLSVAATVTLSDDRAFRWIRRLPLLNIGRETKHVNQMLTELNIRPANPARRKIKFLSGGNQQKALMARAMLSRASVYLFDEPTEGVDIGAKGELHKQVAALAETGAAVLVSSSEPAELVELCTRVLVFSDGKIVAELRESDLNEANIIRHSLAGA